jgi:hypothetical protein
MHVPGPATTPPAVADVSASLCRLPHLLANDAGLHAVAFGFRAELMTFPAGKHGHELDASVSSAAAGPHWFQSRKPDQRRLAAGFRQRRPIPSGGAQSPGGGASMVTMGDGCSWPQHIPEKSFAENAVPSSSAGSGRDRWQFLVICELYAMKKVRFLIATAKRSRRWVARGCSATGHPDQLTSDRA